MLYSWLNVLLVFVPVGIIVEVLPGMPPAIVFSMNALAIIPLAGLLSFATESVAHKMGDSVGALLNVTFGNAVELIILCVSPRFRPKPRVLTPAQHVCLALWNSDIKTRESEKPPKGHIISIASRII